MLLGPIVGSVLYEFLGFELTFFAIGTVFLVLSPVLFMIIPKSVNVRDSFASRSSAGTNQANKYEALAENEDEDSKVIDDTQDINKMEIQESGEMQYKNSNNKKKLRQNIFIYLKLYLKFYLIINKYNWVKN